MAKTRLQCDDDVVPCLLTTFILLANMLIRHNDDQGCVCNLYVVFFRGQNNNKYILKPVGLQVISASVSIDYQVIQSHIKEEL